MTKESLMNVLDSIQSGFSRRPLEVLLHCVLAVVGIFLPIANFGKGVVIGYAISVVVSFLLSDAIDKIKSPLAWQVDLIGMLLSYAVMLVGGTVMEPTFFAGALMPFGAFSSFVFGKFLLDKLIPDKKEKKQ